MEIIKNMSSFQIIKKIIQNFIKTAGIVKTIFTVLFGLLVSFIIIVEPIIFTEIISKVETFYNTWVFVFDEFFYFLVFWGSFILFSILMQYIYRYVLVSHICLKNHRDLSSKYAQKIIKMQYWEYLKSKTWSIYKIFDRWVDYQVLLLFYFFLDLLKSLSGIIFVICILFYFNVKMALVTLSVFPLMFLMWIIFYKKLFPKQQALNDSWDDLFWKLGNFLTNFWLVKSLWLEKTFTKDFDKKVDSCYTQQLSIDKWWSISDIYTAAFVMISRILVLGFGVYYLTLGEITLATLFLYFSYIGWIYFPLWAFFSRLRNLSQWISAIWKFYDTFDNLSEEHVDKKWKNIKKVLWNIEFKNVSFWYSKKRNILKNINFEISSGKKIALVWPTGAGKSTIVNLLMRFWDNYSWEISIDSINIQKLWLKSLRNHIWIVSQDNSLFNLSIRENLLFVNPKASDKNLKEALKKAQAEFVFDLENWLDTIIWERGLKLSGWEKQRLSIARLFLKNPEILILDEATSALDNKTEKQIQKALNELMKSRTSIIIAHRLSTIMDADEIFYIQWWEILESGTYKDLMKDKKSKFSQLASSNHLMIN